MRLQRLRLTRLMTSIIRVAPITVLVSIQSRPIGEWRVYSSSRIYLAPLPPPAKYGTRLGRCHLNLYRDMATIVAPSNVDELKELLKDDLKVKVAGKFLQKVSPQNHTELISRYRWSVQTRVYSLPHTHM